MVIEITVGLVIWIASLYGAYKLGRKTMWDEHIEEIIHTQLEGGPNLNPDVVKPGSGPFGGGDSGENKKEDSSYEDDVLDIMDDE